jgi:hypothetical protein
VPLGVCIVVVLALQFVPERGGSDKADERRAINTQGGPAIIGSQLQQSPVISNSTIEGDVVSAQTIYYQPSSTSLDRQQQRNRRAMLAKVKAIWIGGLLEQFAR